MIEKTQTPHANSLQLSSLSSEPSSEAILEAWQATPGTTVNEPLLPRLKWRANALIGVSSSLLSKIVQLRIEGPSQTLPELAECLRKQVGAFEQAGRMAGVEYGELMAARYILCTVLDEAVFVRSADQAWAAHSLLNHFHQENTGGERFFALVDKAKSAVAHHLQLMELMYLCLSIGYEGKHADNPAELERLRDELYRHILHFRGPAEAALSPYGVSPDAGRRPYRPSTLPGWVLACAVGAGLAIAYVGFAWVLGIQREAALQRFERESSMVPHQAPPIGEQP